MLHCPNKSSALYKALLKLNNQNDNLTTYQYDYVYKLQDDGILSLKRFAPESGKLEYTIPKVVDEKSIAKSFRGESPYAKNVRAFEELDKRITLDDIDWVKVKETKNAYIVEILPPVKETSKPGIQTKLFSLSNVNYQFKAAEKILANLPKIKQWEKVVTNPLMIWEKIQKDLQIPKEQLELLKNSEGKNIEEKLTSFLANYSYTVEINTAKEKPKTEYGTSYYIKDGYFYQKNDEGFFKQLEGRDNPLIEISKEEYEENQGSNTQYYSNLTVPGGTNYTENEISTPLITPSIKGHAQFATDNGIGWFRSDDKTKEGTGRIDEWDDDKNQRVVQNFIGGEATKTRRILEVQSDLFQKGRDKENLAITKNEEDPQFNRPSNPKGTKNQFLQLLNKDNNWVTFFVKSIIQDSAKKGYEKVLFPSGNTASKVEGHATLEEFKKQKEDRIKFLDGEINDPENIERRIEEAKREREQIKQELERIETEGFGALKPIYNFYENTVTNILNKTYGKENIKKITDEYGNTWNEVEITPEVKKQTEKILLQFKPKNKEAVNEELNTQLKSFIKKVGGRIDIVEAGTVENKEYTGYFDALKKLIGLVEGTEDVALPEESGHLFEALLNPNTELYKAMYKNITKFKIYEQVVKDYSKAYNNDENLLKREAIGKLISMFLVNKDYNAEQIADRTKAQGWFNRALAWLKALFVKNKPAVDSYKEAAERILKNDVQDLSDEFIVVKSGTLYQLEDLYDGSVDANAVATQLQDYQKQHGEVPVEMKNTLEKLLLNKKNIFLNEEENMYEDNKGNLFERASTYLKSFVYEGIKGYFDFGETETDYENNRQWGNQIDDVGRAVVLGLTVEETKKFVQERKEERISSGLENTASIDEKVIEEVYFQLKTFFSENYKNTVIVPQVPYSDIKNKVAGVIDFVVVYPDGTIKFRDLKSSSDDVFSDKYTRTFLRDGAKKASKAQRQAAQQSVYKAMAQKSGFIFPGREELGILNVKIETDGTAVVEGNLQKELPINALQAVVEKLGTTAVPKETKIAADNLLDEMKRILESRIASLKESETKAKDFKIHKLHELQRTLRQAEQLSGIVSFVDQIYVQVMGNKPANSFNAQFNKALREIPTKSTYEAIDELTYYRKNADLFLQATTDIQEFYNQYFEEGVQALDDTTWNKMQQIFLVASKIRDSYKKTIIELQADVLEKQISETANADVKAEIASKEKRIAEEKRAGNKAKVKVLEEDLLKYKQQAGGEKGIDRATLLNHLKNGSYSDISSVDNLLSSAGALNAPLLATFYKTLKRKLESARIASMTIAKKSVKIFNEYKVGRNQNNVEEFNKGLFEKVKIYIGKDDAGNPKYKTVASFVQQTDQNAYNEAKAKMFVEREKIKNNEKYAFEIAWLEDNHEEIGQEDITIINPENQKEVVLKKGKKSILKEFKRQAELGIISNKDLEYYQNLAAGNNKKSKMYYELFTQPKLSKYSNPAYAQLQGNAAMKKYYNYLIATYFTEQQFIPENTRLGYILPGINKNSNDLVREKGIPEWIKSKVQENTSLMDYDVDYGVVEGDNKTIPVMFSRPLDFENTSLDLLSSVLIFSDAVHTYKAQTELQSFAESLLDQVKEVGPIKRDGSGNPISWANKNVMQRLGIKNELNEYKKKTDGNNIAAMMAYLIDAHIYNKKRISQTTNIKGKVISIDKSYDTAASFVSFIQIGGLNWVVPLVNYLNGRVQAGIEIASKQFFNGETWRSATAFVDTKGMADVISDYGKPIPESFTGQLMALYNPKNGNFRDEMGKDFSHSGVKRMQGMKSWYFLQQTSENTLVMQVLIARLKTIKVKQNGSDISLFDAYELKNGELSLKQGVVLNGETDGTGIVLMDAKDSVDSILVKMNGAYDKYSRTQVERYWLGRAFMMFHKFFVPGLKRRFKNLGRDEEIGAMTEGFYRTFYHTMFNDFQELVKIYVGGQSKLTPREQANIKRAIREQAFLFLTGAMVMLLQSAGDDADEETRAMLNFPLFVLMKLNIEIGSFGGIGDPQSFVIFPDLGMRKLTQNPIPALQIIENGLKLVNQFQDPFAVYERDSGIWKKGDLKVQAKFFKFWGVTGTNLDPENAIKFLEMNN